MNTQKNVLCFALCVGISVYEKNFAVIFFKTQNSHYPELNEDLKNMCFLQLVSGRSAKGFEAAKEPNRHEIFCLLVMVVKSEVNTEYWKILRFRGV